MPSLPLDYSHINMSCLHDNAQLLCRRELAIVVVASYVEPYVVYTKCDYLLAVPSDTVSLLLRSLVQTVGGRRPKRKSTKEATGTYFFTWTFQQ